MSDRIGIEVKHVTKTYGANKALDDISINFQKETIYGLLGRNGAGKTTLFNVITNRIFPTSGEVLIDGQPATENDYAQEKIYMMSEQNCYPETYSVNDVFKCTKAFYPDFDQEMAKDLCKKFNLNPKKGISQLSTGYGSIYKLITALCVKADYILLDEPVLGLDANHRDLFYQCLLESYAKNPRTFILSTHLIEEVANLVEQVIIIKDGRVIRNESCEELLSSGYSVSGTIAVVDEFIRGKKVIGETVLGGLKTVSILGRCEKANIPAGIEITKLDLQKLFIDLTNC
ncbi:MAG: ABC transporter ATP-binding protein [Clostridiales bacterium]|nr:ABC transporter ATP-binding protein [Clostridiales bacterium]